MAEFADLQLDDGTRFITHTVGQDRFVFEAKNGHILSINIGSTSMHYYDQRLGRGTDENFAKQIFSESPLDAAGDNTRHESIHSLGIPYGKNHNHWASRRDCVYDGIHAMALISTKLGGADSLAIIRMAKST